MSGHYKGIFCQSSYEFAFIYDALARGVELIRNLEGFPYIDEAGKARRYFPDFVIDEIYYEIKGFRQPRDEFKFSAFPHQLLVVEGDEMQGILTQVEENLGIKRGEFYLSAPECPDQSDAKARLVGGEWRSLTQT